MGCSISPILFIAAFEIILIGAWSMVGGVKLQIRTKATTADKLHGRHNKLVAWARMRIKPLKW